MLGGEAEEGREAQLLLLDAREALLGRFGHRLADTVVEVDHDLVEDLLLAREVEVEGALADPGGLGDLDDGRLVVAELGERVLGGCEQPLAGPLAALRQSPAVDPVGLLVAGPPPSLPMLVAAPSPPCSAPTVATRPGTAPRAAP